MNTILSGIGTRYGILRAGTVDGLVSAFFMREVALAIPAVCSRQCTTWYGNYWILSGDFERLEPLVSCF